MKSFLVLVMCAIVWSMGATASAQPIQSQTSAAERDGPPPPVAPDVISRDAAGHATVRAVRISTPLEIDGHLDERVYTEVPPISGFIQNDPQEGAPATERTEVWILFDEDNFYVVGRCFESHPEGIVANEMRRDNRAIVQSDQLAWGLDTFRDRRNMLIFEVSAAGGRIDGQVTNERQVSIDWNPIWAVKTSRFVGGYIVEAAIPFKSLRYRPGAQQVWGIQLRRRNIAKNETSYLTPIPASVRDQGHFRAAMAATLVGLEVPHSRKNLDVKPYVRGNLTTDRTVRPALSNELGGDVGVDVKYGVSQGLNADFTVNTDFAQVEADEQQVNLTRFSLFFPEKRDFFIENAGIFSFGGVANNFGTTADAPLLFYSRTIGLSQGREVPIRAGGRLSGRAGPFTIGALSVQTGAADVTATPSTNFSVVRLKRDLLGRSSVGVMFAARSVGLDGGGSNESYGVDGSFSFGPDLAINTYWAQTSTDTASAANHSYRAILEYNGDRFGAQAEHLAIGPGFLPQLGFVRRRDMRKNLASVRFSPRPKQNRYVRKYLWSETFTNIDNYTTSQLETRLSTARFETQFQNSDVFFLEHNYEYEFLPAPFLIAPGVTLGIGEYAFNTGKVGYNFGQQRRLSGNVSLEYGEFYSGHKTTFSLTSGRVAVGPQISVEPGLTINEVNLVEGQFSQRLATVRATYTISPLMFASALLQYNAFTSSVAANIRFRWEYQPGSELFVVYNEQRDTLTSSFPGLTNGAFIVKINRVFRF